MMTTPQDRLEIASTAMKMYNPTQLESIEDFTPADLARIAADQDIKPEQMPRLIGIMIYIRKRLVEKMSRARAFEIAFPERCIITDSEVDSKFSTDRKPGDKCSNATISMKASRLEQSPMYLKVYNLLQANMYVMYAIERIKVTDEALHIALDPMTPIRDKDRYMKLFLDETRKPDNAKQLELNFNLQSNTVNIASVEDKMNTIAQALNHASAAEIIDIIHQPAKEGQADG